MGYSCESHVLPAIRMNIPNAVNGVVHVAELQPPYKGMASCSWCSATAIYIVFYEPDLKRKPEAKIVPLTEQEMSL